MDRSAFYAALRQRTSGVFGTSISQSQVEGIEAILDEGQRRGTKTARLAYILATAYHETAGRMQPVRETLASTDDGAIRSLESAWKAGKLKWVKKPYWRKDTDGKSWFGRGFVQITHKDNYAKFGLADDPSKALDMATAIRVLFDGMEQGLFTSRKLSDLIDDVDESADEDMKEFVNARSIVNGTDRAVLIAQHAMAFEDALRASKYLPVAIQPRPTIPPEKPPVIDAAPAYVPPLKLEGSWLDRIVILLEAIVTKWRAK